MVPETRYARAVDGTHIAYQSLGNGPVDLVLIRALFTNLQNDWTDPTLAGIYLRLASMGRVVLLDRRGTGLSDRIDPDDLPTLEARHEDIIAVMGALNLRRVVLIGLGAGGAICSTFAAMHPARTAALILWSPTAVVAGHDDPRWGATDAEREAYVDWIHAHWGTRELAAWMARRLAPSRADDASFLEWLTRDMQGAGSADDAVALERMAHQTDVAAILGSIHVPTLVSWRNGSMSEAARHVASRIPNAQMRELPGGDHMLSAGDWRGALREIERFITVVEPSLEDDRVLATVLFVDVVESTELAATIGDAEWSRLVELYHAEVRQQLMRFRGTEIDTAGDGFFAAFDGPARAIRCAQGIRSATMALGMRVRMGLHAGECARAGTALRGVAVHVGARIAACAGENEILISRTVRDLVAGSGISFEDAGLRDLKGISESWRVFRVASSSEEPSDASMSRLNTIAEG
jgi:class 3 adenylate cyclase